VIVQEPTRLASALREVSAPQRPVRVCFLIDRLAAAGTESQLVALIRNLDRQRVEPFLCLLDGTDALYVSVDIDVVNSSDAPATSAPGFRGISARALIEALHLLTGADSLVGMDLCEVNPEFDLSGRTEQLAVDAVLAVIGDRIFERVGELPAEQLAAILFSPAESGGS